MEYPVNLNELKKMPAILPNFTCVAGGDLKRMYSEDEYCIRHCLQALYNLDVGGYSNVTFSCSLLDIYGIGMLHSLVLWLYIFISSTCSVSRLCQFST